MTILARQTTAAPPRPQAPALLPLAAVHVVVAESRWKVRKGKVADSPAKTAPAPSKIGARMAGCLAAGGEAGAWDWVWVFMVLVACLSILVRSAVPSEEFRTILPEWILHRSFL